MTNLTAIPTDPATGLTPPLSKLLASQDLGKHRAMVAVELEVMAKKMDRFGWDRDRGSMAHDRIVTDWMDALQDYPLPEVQSACRSWIKSNPRKMPNEGDIAKLVISARADVVRRHKERLPAEPEKQEPRVTKEQAAEILRRAGFTPKRMGVK